MAFNELVLPQKFSWKKKLRLISTASLLPNRMKAVTDTR